jgi:hypothetical protein
VAVNSIYAAIIPSYKYNLVLKSFSYGTQVMGHPVYLAQFFFFFCIQTMIVHIFFFLQKGVHDNYVYISTIKKYRSVHASGFVLIHHTITKNDLTACD